ncbi:replication-relaxation family protein [Actinocatenispora comari]|uniref:Replication-relaxation n=1 Tax=Actinocatenispora comari TaxID=2807577 RepID=A0A8J4AB33_9ACTN|nr:replication-relaxation family protein [Actinocatenispora comari]GIL25503.1 hypothetical protein NUM_07580 [Actinocatenispora comari]GIL29097.1 hypothetical protein NUM_43510 [Actinocatenispora comari]
MLLELLDQHGTLTTGQITAICFGAYSTADRRLRRLFRLGLLDRFRRYNPHTGNVTGWHWTIGVLGARLIALSAGRPAPARAAVTHRRDQLIASPRLEHLLGVNQTFVDLRAHARTHPGAQLTRWWSERRTAEAFSHRIHPDGHGVWRAGGHTVGFFLEHDTGTETLRRLIDKLPAYTRLAQAGGPAWPVLFWLPTTTRAKHLHDALADQPPLPFAVAIAARVPGRRRGLIVTGPDPAGCLWRVPGHRELLPLAQVPCPHQLPGPLNPGLE